MTLKTKEPCPVAKIVIEKIVYKYGLQWRETLSDTMKAAAVDHELLMVLLQNLDLGADSKQAARFTREVRASIITN